MCICCLSGLLHSAITILIHRKEAALHALALASAAVAIALGVLLLLCRVWPSGKEDEIAAAGAPGGHVEERVGRLEVSQISICPRGHHSTAPTRGY